MSHSMISVELHGLFYIMSAVLLYLISTPVDLERNFKRNFLFVLILTGMSYLFISFEDVSLIPYTLYFIPIALSLALCFQSFIPVVCTWLALNFMNYVLLGHELWPTLYGSTAMLILGFIFSKRIHQERIWAKISAATGITAAYFIFYFASHPHQAQGFFNEGMTTLPITIVSSWLVALLYVYASRLELRKEKLYRTEKDRVIGQMAASVSHEIRNSLTTARGFLQMMDLRNLSDEEYKRYMGLAISGIDQADGIIHDYLQHARPVQEIVQKLDIYEELEAVIRFLSPLALANGINVNVQHSTEQLHILADSKKLRQCLMNLIKNSIESMTMGGSITISTCKRANSVQITIRDTGVGMSKAQIKSLGLPFYTTKEKGTGLGLVVVMSLMKSMNGTITFSSQLNQGTSCQLQFKSS